MFCRAEPWRTQPSIPWCSDRVKKTAPSGSRRYLGRARRACHRFPLRHSAEMTDIQQIAVMYPSDLKAGTIVTVAGTGAVGDSGDHGPATKAQLNQPGGVAVDRAGNVYVSCMWSGAVRRIAANGTITTVLKPGILHMPNGLALDGAGNLYIAELAGARVHKLAPDGTLTTVAGTGQEARRGEGGEDDVDATSSRLGAPAMVTVDDAGNLYFSEFLGCRVRKVSPKGIIRTVAGNGSPGFNGDGISARSSQLCKPYGLALDRTGALLIADSRNKRVRKVTPDGIIHTVAGPLDAEPWGITLNHDGDLFIASPHANDIRKMRSNGAPTTIAGHKLHKDEHGSGDNGPAKDATFDCPHDLAFDSSGNLFVVDMYVHRLRMIAQANRLPIRPKTKVTHFNGFGASDKQHAQRDTDFQTPLRVEARNGSDLVPEARVRFEVTAGDAAFRSTNTTVTEATSDSSGIATAPVLHAGHTPGPVTIRITSPDNPGASPSVYSATID